MFNSPASILKGMSREEVIELRAALGSLSSNAGWLLFAGQMKKELDLGQVRLELVYPDASAPDALGSILRKTMTNNEKVTRGRTFESALQWLQELEAACDKYLSKKGAK